LKLKYSKNLNTEVLDCFVDADWAGDVVDRKSTTGFIIRMYGNVIFWKTKKQNTVTKSSTSAEYVALSEAISEINVIRGILKSFNINLREPTKIYEDNSGALIIAKNGNFTKNSKHIEVQYHYVNENYLSKIIDIIKIETNKNIADILTKALDRQKLTKFREMLQITE